MAAAGVFVAGGRPRGRRGRTESRGGGGRKEGGRRRRSANRWGRGRTVSTLGEMTTGMTSLSGDVTGSGVIILQVRCISTDPQVPLCFRSAEEEAGWRGRSREMSLVEQPSIRESSLLSSDLSEAGGGALSAERKRQSVIVTAPCRSVRAYSLVYVQSVNTEGAGLRCHTATSHQGRYSCYYLIKSSVFYLCSPGASWQVPGSMSNLTQQST